MPEVISILLLLWGYIQTSKTEVAIPLKAISGIHLEESPYPILYDNVIPFLFRFRLPKWGQEHVILYESKCASPEWTKGSSCPTTYFIDEVQRRFSTHILNSQPFYEAQYRKPSGINVHCGVIEKHFQNRNMNLTSLVLEDYLAKLKECSPIKEIEFIRNIGDYDYDVKQVYLNMSVGFKSEVWAKIPADRIDGGLWANAVSSLNALVFLNFEMEVHRWKFAIQECASGRIPTTILTREMFNNALDDVMDTLVNSTFSVAIKAKSISIYSNSGLSDCAFSNGNFIVKILIPVVSTAPHRFSLISVKGNRFWSNNTHTCQHSLKNMTPRLLVDTEKSLVYNTDCMSDELCHILSATSVDKINPCVSTYIKPNISISDVMKVCPLTCTEISPYIDYQTVIEQVESDAFSIGGNANGTTEPDVIIRCDDQPDQFLRPVSVGSLLVTLPCDCKLYFLSVVYSPSSSVPCPKNEEISSNGNVTIRHVIPMHWISIDFVKGKLIEQLGTLELNESLVGVTMLAPDQTDLGTEGLESHSQFWTVEMNLIFLTFACIFPTVLVALVAYQLKQLTIRVESIKLLSTHRKEDQEMSYKQLLSNSCDENVYEETEFLPTF